MPRRADSIRHHYAVRPVDTVEVSLRGVGVHEVMGPGVVSRPRGVDCWLFVCFHDEVATVTDSVTSACPEGTLVIWGPGVAHEFGDHRRPWNHTWLLSGGRLFDRELRRLRIPCNVPLGVHAAAVMDKALLEIDREAMLRPRADPAYVRNLLHNLLIDVARLVHDRTETPRVPHEYLEVKRYLENHASEPVTLALLAGLVHRSVPRFASRFKSLFGVPPLEYLTRLRMQRAAFLLHDHGLTIAEVGRAVGYEDSHYFSRAFRQRFGCSPTQARRGT